MPSGLPSITSLAVSQAEIVAICLSALIVAFAACIVCAVSSRRMRKHKLAFVVFAIGMTIAAQKDLTNGTDGVSAPMPPMMQMGRMVGDPPPADEPSDSVTNETESAQLEFTSFFLFTNGVGFAAGWIPGLGLAYLDLRYSEHLDTDGWNILDRWAVSPAQTNDTRFIPYGGSFTNAATGFFGLRGYTYDADPDGDRLSVGQELRLGTDPFAADTDGDGSSDGEELGTATVLTGDDFLWFDMPSAFNRVRTDRDSYWWLDDLDDGFRVCGERLGRIESSIDGFTHFYVSEIPNVLCYGWYDDAMAFRTNSLSGGFLTVAAANADLYARPDAWGSAFRYASVTTNGVTYYVLQCANLGLKANRTGESPLLSYEVFFSEDVPDVVYVSYGRVDEGIRSLDMKLGVQVAAWRNPLATNEYYTLMSPVAGSNLCAGTTIRYGLGAATDPLAADTDGDGVPDGSDPLPHDAALGSYGQDENWVRMNFDNAEEIISVGYADWVADAAADDPCRYVFTVSVTNALEYPVRLTVGESAVAVTNAGDYVFLLKNGVEYAVGHSALPEGVAFAYSWSAGGESPSSLGAGAAGDEVWTTQGELGSVEFWPPGVFGVYGKILRHPPLVISPDRLVDPQYPVTFSASVALDDFNPSLLHWESDDGAVSAYGSTLSIAAPGSYRIITVSYPYPLRPLYGTITVERGGGDEPFAFSLAMPTTLFVNDDDDDGNGAEDFLQQLFPPLVEDDVYSCEVGLRSSAPAEGTVTFEGVSDFAGHVFDDDTREEIDMFDTWDPLLPGGVDWRKRFWLNPTLMSVSYLGSWIGFSWTPESGPARRVVSRFTVVSPEAEPVCSNVIHVVEADGAHDLVLNPSGIVVGKDSYFRIKVDPPDYPDMKIRWFADGVGTVDFPDGNIGRTVRVRGVSPGDVSLSVQIGDCPSARPSFPARVVMNSTVKVSAWIVERNGQIPRTIDEVRELIRQANDIYRQVGVTLDIGDRISITNIPKAYNILFEGTSETMWNFDQLVNTHTNTGGLELYFVNEFYGISGNPMGTRGCSNGFGLVVKKTGDAITLAHEIGHSLGLFDIYISNDESDEGISSADALSVETDFVQQAFLSLDWSGENHGSGTGGTRYYSSGLTMRRLIPRLLMYGIYVKGKRDLTLGSVCGVWYEEYDVGKVWHKSDAPIGTASPGSFNVNRKHL